jgi:precorrin-2 methylase
MSEAPFDIALLGWGTRGVDQLTVEHLRAIGQARAVAVDPGTPASIVEMLREYPVEVHDLAALYEDGAAKREVYEAMARTVLGLAARLGPTVWMTYGHPLLYSTPSRLLREVCARRGLRLTVLSGISSIAEITTALGLDIAERGLQVHFANRLVARAPAIDPTVDLVIMQPGGLGETHLCRDPVARQARDLAPYAALQAHLERFYPPAHRYTSICLSDEGTAHEIFEASIARIVELAPALHYGHTWYVRALPDEARGVSQ